MSQSPFDQRLIGAARQHAAQTANAALMTLFWRVRDRLRREVLKVRHSWYGEPIVPTLSTQLKRHYSQRVTAPNPARMVQFAKASRDENIVATLSQQLSRSRFVVPGHAA